ncbi:MAG: AAA family ATPase [Gammaproteobacteria bacterium]|jgi:general secretion pathway protein A
MYLKHFNLTDRPFAITPDPRFLYLSARHREALAHLLYGLGEGGGFVQLTGEVGTGKTTICRCLLEHIPDNVDLALVLNPKVTAHELIATVCDELGIDYPRENSSIKTLTDVLNRYLLEAYAKGRRTVLIIDEAQNLSADVLEQVRLLTNLETATQKLLQIILIGQPELRMLLAREDMRQLAQRVTARYHLEPISLEETGAYIRHRLQICGTSQPLFNRSAIDRIQRLSGGIPRLINVLCDRAMLGAYVEGKSQVDARVVRKAAHEVLAEEQPGLRKRRWLPAAGLGAGLLVLLLLAVYQPWEQQVPAAAPGDAAVQAETTPAAAAAAVQPEASEMPAPAKQMLADNSAAAVTDESGGADVRSLGELLLASDSSFNRAAWTELLALWSVILPQSVQSDFCDFTPQYGLLCKEGQGNWNILREFDRPAILTLLDADGRRVPVVLQHLDDTVAELMIGTALYRLAVEQVDRYWYGEYLLLLQTPPGGRINLKAGDRGADIPWLRRQLEQALDVDIPAADPQLFDYAMQKWVLDFQRSRGLVADGIVGENTLIQLNTRSQREGVPRLSL